MDVGLSLRRKILENDSSLSKYSTDRVLIKEANLNSVFKEDKFTTQKIGKIMKNNKTQQEDTNIRGFV